MEKLASSKQKPRHWIWTSCPNTHEEVIGSGWYQQFAIPDGYATWWYCPSCCGWHVRQLTMLNGTEYRLEKSKCEAASQNQATPYLSIPEYSADA